MAAAAVTWTDSASLGVAAATLLALAVTALYALKQVNHARTRWATEMRREWRDLAQTREMVGGLSPNALRAKFETAWRTVDADYFVLIREPAYWDRMAFLVRKRVVSRAGIEFLIGPDIVFRWRLWEPAIGFLRHDCGFTNAYEGFEALAKQSARLLVQYRKMPGGPSDVYTGPR